MSKKTLIPPDSAYSNNYMKPDVTIQIGPYGVVSFPHASIILTKFAEKCNWMAHTQYKTFGPCGFKGKVSRNNYVSEILCWKRVITFVIFNVKQYKSQMQNLLS